MDEIIFFSAALVTGCALDLILGDPERLPHPVRWTGGLVNSLERFFRKYARGPAAERFFGFLLAVVTVGAVYLLASLALYLSYRRSGLFFFIIWVYIIWTSISIRSLAAEVHSVTRSLEEEGLPCARKRLRRIVGRDTAGLSREEVLRAAAESVAENTSDGIVAPLFYLALGGPALMLAYKAVNTLDSMTGYRNARYRDFGWFPARLDDAANYIPARATALLMVPASMVLGYDWRGSLNVLLRDGRKHPSPNAGLPEAAVAGALGVRFGGTMSYGGVASAKPFIGDDTFRVGPGTVESSIRIMLASSGLAVILAIALHAAAFLLI